MTITMMAARCVATFAGNSTVPDHMSTDEFENLAITIGVNADTRRILFRDTGKDFFCGAFAEAAAVHLNNNPWATVDELLTAGQRESNAIAN